jgi:hypothetical protein
MESKSNEILSREYAIISRVDLILDHNSIAILKIIISPFNFGAFLLSSPQKAKSKAKL